MLWGKMGECGEKICIFVAEFLKAMRFLGNIEAKTDAKGRVFLPSAFRKVLQASGSEGLVMRKDIFQNCLVLYPEKVWNEQIPKRYLLLADIQQGVRFIGMGDTIEIWATGRIEESQMNGEEFGRALEEVMGGGVFGTEAEQQ